jgi:SAM-dependent methyltransferase
MLPNFVCRGCGASSGEPVVDLGMSPLCESYLQESELDKMEPFYPLRVEVCTSCWLAQLRQYVSAEHIFNEYAYFSSYSDSWLRHCEQYVAKMVERLRLGPSSRVVELASNDGYLLQYFVKRGIPALGIEPAANVAKAAEAKGVQTLVRFFDEELGRTLAKEGRRADLVIGNNVLAQVPDLRSFIAGLPHLLAPGGTATFEFPHLLRLFQENQFDTIYHEHFCYFSLLSAQAAFARQGLAVHDVDELPTHGGSLRLYLRHAGEAGAAPSPAVLALLARERAAGLDTPAAYRTFEAQVRATKRKLLSTLIALKEQGRSIAGYGAPGKGNTLLNYCGLRADFLDYTVDRNPYKQGRFLPGTHVPIFAPEKLAETRPDYIFILPWNLKDEIVAQLSYARAWGAKFIVPIPSAEVL